MNKLDFLFELEKRLQALPDQEKKQALEYYFEIVDDRMDCDMTEEEAGEFFAKADPQTGFVSADCTICFHAKKPVHDLPQAAGALGELVVADIGIADVLR